MDRPRMWSGTLEADTAARVHNLIDTILHYRCTCVSIVQSSDNIEVQTSRSAEIKEGKAAHLAEDSRHIDWSIGGYFVSDYETDERMLINVSQIVSIEETGLSNSCVVKTTNGEFKLNEPMNSFIEISSEIEVIELRKGED